MHHPSDATLAAFASGTLDEVHALVVATHLARCAQCRDAVRSFESVGGALLDANAPTPMAPGAFERTMARLDRDPSAVSEPASREDASFFPDSRRPGDPEIPATLSRYPLGPWRWLGRGVQWRMIDVAAEDGTRAFMLKAAPGIKLPRHRHTGTEWTCVLQGAFRHAGGRYGAGDFDEADDAVEHDPFVESGEVCICVVAMQGTIELQGWLGRLLQPLVRM
jgi:putative transcriptional regulator